MVDRAQGRVTFGDGEHGKVPPAGAAIQAFQYQAGGGRAGNTPANAISQLLGPAPGMDGVSNPLPAEGGADGESMAALAERGPSMLGNHGRAVTPGDYEALAYQAAPDLGWVRAVPSRDRSGHVRPGWVTLLVVPDNDEDQPWPSFGLRENIRLYVEARAGADIAAADHVVVTGPVYLPIDVEATLVAVDPSESGAVAARAQDALKQFFNPVRGGPNGQGWDLGRDVFLSDVATVLEHVEGLDHVTELALFANEVQVDTSVDVPDGKVAAAGDFRLKV
jgi:predicted phage baseplate assembly protein